MNLDAIAKQIGCQETRPLVITGVGIDSRTIKPGELFVAIRGERFDGHDFMGEAIGQGAAAILCERYDSDFSHIPQLLVRDSLRALVTLASWHRQQISCPVIALTGSNGKTTVKEMIASILPQPSYATSGNLNNHIGVPLCILQLKATHRYAVFELGANHPQEILHTVAMVKPDVTLINNIAPAHIEGFGSLEGVAVAKGEIHQGLAAQGTAIINEDDDFAHFWDNVIGKRNVLRFSSKKPASVTTGSIVFNEAGCASFDLALPSGSAHIALQVPGHHSVQNALAAGACCHALGIDIRDIAAGLNRFQGVSGRMTYRQGKNQSVVIDDTYNANLRSVLTAVEVLSKRQGRRILVLGDMGELGVWTQAHHEEAGRFAQAHGIDLVMTCGNNSEFASKAFGGSGRHYQQHDALTKDLLPILDKETTVLVKGSRSARMEKIVSQLVG